MANHYMLDKTEDTDTKPNNLSMSGYIKRSDVLLVLAKAYDLSCFISTEDYLLLREAIKHLPQLPEDEIIKK